MSNTKSLVFTEKDQDDNNNKLSGNILEYWVGHLPPLNRGSLLALDTGDLMVSGVPISISGKYLYLYLTLKVLTNKQVCIPVGYVPPASVAITGVWIGRCTPLRPHTPHHRYSCPHTHLLVACWDTPTQVHAGICTPPRGQNDWHVLVKTLPSHNFICRW